MKFDEIKTPFELLDYMQKNIKYGFVSNDGNIYDDPASAEYKNDWYSKCIVQDAESILKTKYGTCWDQVELERKWFEENNYKYTTIYIWFEINKPGSWPTHTFLVYEENDKYFWFEHAFYDYQGIHEFSSIEEVINKVKQAQLNMVIKQNQASKDDYKYIVEYQYDKPIHNISVDEYIKHVTKSIIEKSK